MTEGWRTGRLIDFASVSTGPFGSLLHKSDYVSDGVPLVNPINIVGDQITPDPEKLIDKQTVSRLASYILRQGDIVVSRRGELGRCATIGPDESGWVCGTGCFFIRPGNDVEPRFLAAMLRSDRYRRAMEMASTGATMPSVSNTTLCNLPIAIPERNEQRRIVALLDEAFAGIATAKTNVEKSMRNAREVFSGYLDAMLDMNKDVKERRLGDLATRLTNGYVGPIKNVYVETGVPYLLARHVRDNKLKFDGKTFITNEFNQKNRKSILKIGDVLLVQSGHIGHSAVVPEEHEGHNCHAMIVITPVEGAMTGEFLSLLFNSAKMRKEFDAIRSGSTVPHLTCKEVREMAIKLPDLGIQKKMVAQSRELHAQTRHLESLYTRKLAALAELKQSLLQRAFSGELT